MRRFLFLLIFGLAGTGILVSLGVWQMQRLAWKSGILAQISARIADAPQPLPAMPDPETDKYQPTVVTGTFDKPELHVLTSVRFQGPGYRVIQAFVTDGRRIMIDRGFVPAPAKDTPRALRTVTLTGNLHWPDEIDSFTPEPDRAGNIWFARDVSAMAQALGTEPVLIIQRDPLENDTSTTPLAVDTTGIPNDHLQYALTWFSLAAVWAGMTGYFLWRTRRANKGTST